MRGHRVDAPEAAWAAEEGGTNPLADAWGWLTTRFAGYELAMGAGAIAIIGGVLVPDGVRAAGRARSRME